MRLPFFVFLSKPSHRTRDTQSDTPRFTPRRSQNSTLFSQNKRVSVSILYSRHLACAMWSSGAGGSGFGERVTGRRFALLVLRFYTAIQQLYSIYPLQHPSGRARRAARALPSAQAVALPAATLHIHRIILSCAHPHGERQRLDAAAAVRLRRCCCCWRTTRTRTRRPRCHIHERPRGKRDQIGHEWRLIMSGGCAPARLSARAALVTVLSDAAGAGLDNAALNRRQ